jgi:hypothetical protein
LKRGEEGSTLPYSALVSISARFGLRPSLVSMSATRKS